MSEIRQTIKYIITIPFEFLDLDECEIEKADENELLLKIYIRKWKLNIISEEKILSEGNKNEYTPQKELEHNDYDSVNLFKEKYKDKIYIDKTKIGPKFDFSIFEILEKEEDLIIYKYSNKKYISNHDSLYQYFYDDFSFDDYKNA